MACKLGSYYLMHWTGHTNSFSNEKISFALGVRGMLAASLRRMVKAHTSKSQYLFARIVLVQLDGTVASLGVDG